MSRYLMVFALIMLLVPWTVSANPERTFVLPGDAEIEMVWIEPGTFTMGTTEEQEQLLRSKGMWNHFWEAEQPAHQQRPVRPSPERFAVRIGGKEDNSPETPRRADDQRLVQVLRVDDPLHVGQERRAAFVRRRRAGGGVARERLGTVGVSFQLRLAAAAQRHRRRVRVQPSGSEPAQRCTVGEHLFGLPPDAQHELPAQRDPLVECGDLCGRETSVGVDLRPTGGEP